MMRSRKLVVSVVVLAAALSACPDPQEIGAAPHAQVDIAKERLDKAEQKLQANTAAADAAKE